MTLFETDRALLRCFEIKDFKPLSEMMTNSSVMTFTGFKEPQEPERISKLLNDWILEGKMPLGVWAAVSRVDYAFLGWFMLKPTSSNVPELGFMITESQWGKGYATEISKGLINYGFSKVKCERIVASVAPENLASIAVLSKIGMVEVLGGALSTSLYEIKSI